MGAGSRIKKFGEALPGIDPEAACEQRSGKTLAEWQAIWRERRDSGLRSFDLQSSKLYSESEVDALFDHYGFEWDDMERVKTANGHAYMLKPHVFR